MKIAIACPGASLKRTWPIPVEHDVTICVNAAARLVQPDWFVAGDAAAYVHAQRLAPGCGICSPRALATCPNRPGGDCRLDWEDLRHLDPAIQVECNYSSIAAMALAMDLILGPGQIHLYGFDMDAASTKNCLGQDDDWSHERWDREWEHLWRMVGIAASRQVNVLRFMPDNIEHLEMS